MKVSRLLTWAAAVWLAAAAVDAAQGQRPARPNRPARGRVTAAPPQGTSANRPQRPKAERPAERPATDRSRAAARQEARDSIAANIARNPQLEARLKAMLPPGMTMEQASQGFRNQGQFIAALEASRNHNVDFADLKAEMTDESPLSLGEAIQKLRPSRDR